jgi:hypothetical protein
VPWDFHVGTLATWGRSPKRVPPRWASLLVPTDGGDRTPAVVFRTGSQSNVSTD